MGVTAGLRQLLGKLVPYKVNFEHEEYGSSNDHVESLDLAHADVISSKLTVGEAVSRSQYKIVGDDFDLEQILDLHQIVIDVDLPVHVVESSTPGHHHLYVELANPISTERYFQWLEASAEIGLVEPGYVQAFKDRGFTCVRLPWVSKTLGNLVDTKVPLPFPVEEWKPSTPWPTDPNAPTRSEIPTEDLRF